MLTDASRLSKSRDILFLTGRNRELQNSKCKEESARKCGHYFPKERAFDVNESFAVEVNSVVYCRR